jgi:hypothetical protein
MPPAAQFAEAQAKQLAANIVARLNSESTLPFKYPSRGQLSSIGHNKGRCRSWGREDIGFHCVVDVARSVHVAHSDVRFQATATHRWTIQSPSSSAIACNCSTCCDTTLTMTMMGIPPQKVIEFERGLVHDDVSGALTPSCGASGLLSCRPLHHGRCVLHRL